MSAEAAAAAATAADNDDMCFVNNIDDLLLSFRVDLKIIFCSNCLGGEGTPSTHLLNSKWSVKSKKLAVW